MGDAQALPDHATQQGHTVSRHDRWKDAGRLDVGDVLDYHLCSPCVCVVVGGGGGGGGHSLIGASRAGASRQGWGSVHEWCSVEGVEGKGLVSGPLIPCQGCLWVDMMFEKV